MSKPATNQPTSSDRVAIIHLHGGAWRALLSRRATGQHGGIAVEQAQSVAAGDPGALCALLLRWKPGALAIVVPASALVVRTISGENGQAPALSNTTDPGQFRAAMDLVAEAHLGGSLGEHRRGAGVLKIHGASAPVAIGWAGSASGFSAVLDRKELSALAKACTFVPEPVAMAAALNAAPGATVALSVDRVAGSIALVGGHDGRAVVRVLREDGEDEAHFGAVIAAHCERAGAALAIAAPRVIQSALPACLLRFFGTAGQSVAHPVSDLAGGEARCDEFAVARGAAVALAAADPAVRPLLSLRAEAPVPHIPVIVRAIDWFSKPSRGVAVLAACLVVALLWPLGSAWARHRILSDRAAESGSDDEAAADARKQAEFYQLLKDKRWPMTKLLGDLSASMPAGITLETMTIEYNQKVRITGSAESAQVVSEWREALDKSKVFDEVQVPRNEATSTSGTFDLVARVAQPLVALGSTQKVDPALIKVAAPAQPVNEPPRSAPAAKSEPAKPEAAGATKAGARPTNTRNTPRGATAADKPAADAVPAPISDEEIAQLDRTAAMREFASRSKASKTATDPTVIERLKAEAEKCKNQMQKAAGGGT